MQVGMAWAVWKVAMYGCAHVLREIRDRAILSSQTFPAFRQRLSVALPWHIGWLDSVARRWQRGLMHLRLASIRDSRPYQLEVGIREEGGGQLRWPRGLELARELPRSGSSLDADFIICSICMKPSREEASARSSLCHRSSCMPSLILHAS
jgi:hypothetical protein